MSNDPIPLNLFDTTIKPSYVEVSSAALGSQIVACSDDFFASRHNLIKPTPSVSMKGQFGPNGALYDGWESRRHNAAYDWVIIQLATPLTFLNYVDIDTSHFNGNEAPQSQVFALEIPADGTVPKWTPGNPDWVEVLPVVDLGPDSRHIFQLGKVAQHGNWGAIMVRMIPDGGMARFRAYGLPHAPSLPTALPENWTALEPTNLLSPLIGGRIISCSDAQFSPPGNLLLPGRGHDMSDGWETRRSQENRGKYAPGGALYDQERKEWVVAKLGVQGVIKYVEVDTAFHPGNYPKESSLEATLSSDEELQNAQWTTIVRKTPLGPHRQHYLPLEPSVPQTQVFSHIRYIIYPDGGSKRVRIFGHPLDPASPQAAPAAQATETTTKEPMVIPALPLTPETFKEYGQVIQGFSLPTSAPKGTHVNVANQGTAFKFHRLAPVSEPLPEDSSVQGGVHIRAISAKSQLDITGGIRVKIDKLERSLHTSKAVIPMGQEEGKEQGAFLVVVACEGDDGKPDLKTVRAFLATAAQGVSFDKGIWHNSLTAVGGDLNFAIVEAQSSDSSAYEQTASPSDFFVEVPSFPFSPSKVSPPSKLQQPLADGMINSQDESVPISSLLPGKGEPLKPVAISAEKFAPFGHLIAASPTSFHDSESVPARLAPVESSYPEDAGAVTGIAVFRATKKVGLERGKVFDVRFLERHPYTTQAFIPMGKAEWPGKSEEALPIGGQFLVIVAKNGPDDKPDPSTLQTFLLPAHQGLSYAPGTWHHPVLVLDSTLDLACVETQIATGVHDSDGRDCELLERDGSDVFGRVAVPE